MFDKKKLISTLSFIFPPFGRVRVGSLPSLGRGWGWGCLLAILLMVSCKDDDQPLLLPTPNYTAAQTIIIIQPYTQSLSSSLAQNINDIKKNIIAQGGLHDSRLMLCQASSSNKATLKELYFADGTVQEQVIKQYNNFSLAGKENLTTVLKDVRQQVFNSNSHYSLMIGCHGMGWVPSTTYNQISRYFGGDGTNTHTEIYELADAIEDADMHMDFILFDDCYMACVEVAYELKDVTDYLLASPAEIMDYGLPYADLFHYFSRLPHDYASVMTAFKEFYTSYRSPYGTYATIDCSVVEEMAALMKTVNDNDIFDFSQEPELQVYDGMKVNSIYKHVFYDMGDYTSRLCSDASLSARLAACLQRLVPYKATTGKYFSKYDGLYHDVNVFSGITISDPTTNYRFTPALHDTQWWNVTHTPTRTR